MCGRGCSFPTASTLLGFPLACFRNLCNQRLLLYQLLLGISKKIIEKVLKILGNYIATCTKRETKRNVISWSIIWMLYIKTELRDFLTELFSYSFLLCNLLVHFPAKFLTLRLCFFNNKTWRQKNYVFQRLLYIISCVFTFLLVI